MEFNIFRNLGLHETQHTNLLKKFLYPRGQDVLFMNKFLELNCKVDLQIESDRNFTFLPKKAGTGFVDIIFCVWNGNKKLTIIIENKSNQAGNQPNQLYRYWRHKIFKPEKENFKKYCESREISLNSINDENLFDAHKQFQKDENITQKYMLIYLTKKKEEGEKKYGNSKRRPDNPTYKKTKELLPTKLPFPVTELNYEENICNWLENCRKEIKQDEILSNVVEQYIKSINSGFYKSKNV